MTYEFYIKQSMERVELNLNMIIFEIVNLINSLDWSIKHPFIREYSIFPFKFQQKFVLNVNNDIDLVINCTDNKNEDINIIIKDLLLSIPSSVFLLCLMRLIIWTILKYPNHPVRCLISGPYECGKIVFLTKLIKNNNIEFDRLYIYSPSLHQYFLSKIN